ncbi:hypothetical protein MNBD_GAMMA08-780 [hydrothermal vent metagenome]|uniref:Uncharacterized protein n=1 Tax=hydrothermal vent metagenome TaxID=652676 RepID=A0A3B0WTY5_9ZZZZ
MCLKVSQVELGLKVEFSKALKGDIDLKLVKIGTGISSYNSNTITVVFCPRSIIPTLKRHLKEKTLMKCA